MEIVHGVFAGLTVTAMILIWFLGRKTERHGNIILALEKEIEELQNSLSHLESENFRDDIADNKTEINNQDGRIGDLEEDQIEGKEFDELVRKVDDIQTAIDERL